MSVLGNKNTSEISPDKKFYLPFALPIVEGKKMKKKCCKKYKKGKRCKRCPGAIC